MEDAAVTDMHAPETLEQARQIVRQNTLWAMGAGALPIPLLDIFGIAAVELRMVKQLCGAYGVDFNKRDAKMLITALMASTGSVALGTGVGSLLKAVPLVGPAAGCAAVALAAGTFVHAIGNVFVQHFAAKGTLKSLDPAQMRGYFGEEIAKAKNNIRDIW
jgi:uncharacterized protein (DUF697 family)